MLPKINHIIVAAALIGQPLHLLASLSEIAEDSETVEVDINKTIGEEGEKPRSRPASSEAVQDRLSNYDEDESVGILSKIKDKIEETLSKEDSFQQAKLDLLYRMQIALVTPPAPKKIFGLEIPSSGRRKIMTEIASLEGKRAALRKPMVTGIFADGARWQLWGWAKYAIANPMQKVGQDPKPLLAAVGLEAVLITIDKDEILVQNKKIKDFIGTEIEKATYTDFKNKKPVISRKLMKITGKGAVSQISCRAFTQDSLGFLRHVLGMWFENMNGLKFEDRMQAIKEVYIDPDNALNVRTGILDKLRNEEFDSEEDFLIALSPLYQEISTKVWQPNTTDKKL